MDDVPFYVRDERKGRVDNPTLAGTPGFSVEILQGAGTAPEEEDGGSYQLYVLRDASSSSKSVSQILEEGGESKVLFWRSPSAPQVRAAKRRCPGIG